LVGVKRRKTPPLLAKKGKSWGFSDLCNTKQKWTITRRKGTQSENFEREGDVAKREKNGLAREKGNRLGGKTPDSVPKIKGRATAETSNSQVQIEEGSVRGNALRETQRSTRKEKLLFGPVADCW